MAHYTSRAEGLKIKEYKDYYDWNDDIRIRYNPNSSNANWVFTALFEEGIWMNGVLYPQNSVIASFKDGVEVNYTMMAQHKTYDEITGEVISVTNILYRVTSSITTNTETSTPIVQDISQQNEEIEIGDELPDEITYTIKSLPNGNHKDVEVKKYKNGTLVGTSRVTPDKITAYKVAHSQAVYKEYQVFNHLGFLWHGQNPESGYPQYSYTVMSRCDYLEVEGSQYGPHDYITTWTWDQDINLTVYDYSIPAEPYVPEDNKYPVIEVQFDTKAGSNNTVIVSKISDGVTISTKEVTSEEILKSKLKGSRLRIFENFLMDFNNNASEQAFIVYSDSNYIKYNGTYVGQNKEIESWPAISNVSFKVVDETNRYTKTIKKNDSFVVHLTINGSGDQDLKKGDEIYSAVFYDHIKMYYNGKYHYAAWLAYDQPNVPGHYKTLGGLAIGWCRPYWVLITTAEGIYFNGRTYQARKLLKTWNDEDAVHLTLTQKKARKKTELNDKDSEIIKYTIITDENSNKINLTKYVNDLETANSSFNPELVENRTFNGIAFTIGNGIINLYSKSDYVKFQNEGYKAKTFITSWAINEKANFEVYDKDFDKIQYVMDTSLSSNVITITKEINDLVDDTVEFNPDTTANLDFHNIRFSVRNGKVYVYSKSDFIKLSGSTYKKGNQIINWPIEEKVYFAIVDESIKYEIVTSITYNVDTEQVTEVDYLIETIGDEQWKPLRIQKRIPLKDPITGRIITYNLAGEEIINYYDCVRPPYYIYDGRLQFEFNLGYYVWYLKSASDDVYVNNEQYPAGTLIRSWNWANVEHFDDIGHIEDSHKEIRIKSTTVDTKKSYETTHEYVTNPTYHIETKTEDRTLILTCDQPGSSTVTHNLTWHEIHSVTWYTFYELQFNYTTEGGWKLRAGSNTLVVSNKKFSKGEIISKWGYADDVDFGVEVLLEDIKHTQKTDVEKALMVSTEDEWMYGYIWKRYAPPGPTPSRDYDWDIFAIGVYDDYNGYKMAIAIDTTFGSRYAKRLYQTGDYVAFRDFGSISLDLGDVGYLTTNYDDSHSFSTNSIETVVYGSSSSVSVSRKTPIQAQFINIISGSNNVETFNISSGDEYLHITKKTYDKYLNNVISEIETTHEPIEIIGDNSFYYCFSGRKIYFHVAPTYYVTPGYYGGYVIDMDTAEIVETLPMIGGIDIDEIAEEMWNTISPTEKEAFFNNSIDILKNNLRSSGVRGGAYINDEMIVMIGFTGASWSPSYGIIGTFWYKFYRYSAVKGTFSVISTNYGIPNIPPYYGVIQNTRNKKLCTYVESFITSDIDIYELSEYSIDGLIAAEKVGTINKADTVQLWRLDTNSYQTFTKGQIFEAIRAYGGRQRQTLPYSTISSRFKTYTSGNFGYIQNGYDRWIICITDETLQDFSESFCFLASELSSRGTLDEHNYRPGPQ